MTIAITVLEIVAPVFLLAAGMALVSLLLSLLIPRHPVPGHAPRLARAIPAPAE